MTKKKREKEEKKYSWLQVIKDLFQNKIFSQLRERLDEFLNEMQSRIYQTGEVLTRKFISALILLAGFIFLAISAVFYLKENGFSFASSFFIIGAILIIIFIIFSYFNLKKQISSKK